MIKVPTRVVLEPEPLRGGISLIRINPLGCATGNHKLSVAQTAGSTPRTFAGEVHRIQQLWELVAFAQ